MDRFTVTSCVTTCIIIYTIFTIILKLWRRRNLFKQASKFPGPPTLPIIGNALLVIGNTETIFNRLIRVGALYPSPYRLWLGNYLIFVVNAPEQLKIVLLSPKTANKGVLYNFVKPWLGTGLLTASNPKWRAHRKLVQPTFGSTILRSLVGIFVDRSMTLTKELEPNLNEPEFDIYSYISRCTLHTICETTMGVKLGKETIDNGRYAESIETVIASVFRRAISPWLHPNFIFHRTQLGKDQHKDIEFLHDFADNVIKTKKKELLERNRRPDSSNNEEDAGSWIPPTKVFVEHMLEMSGDSKTMSDEELREEVDTIMVAGSETTAITICSVMMMLASHPEIQEKVYCELREIHEGRDTENLHVTAEDLTRMKYMERVINETMRLFPVSPVIIRSVTEDLDIGERSLPAGSLAVISIIELHRNGDIWPDPLKFDPDRFLPEEVRKRDPYTYLPFSGGPRNCIGMKYAMMSMKTVLATVLQRYVLKKDNITPVKDLRFKLEFLLRPADPVTLRIERRT